MLILKEMSLRQRNNHLFDEVELEEKKEDSEEEDSGTESDTEEMDEEKESEDEPETDEEDIEEEEVKSADDDETSSEDEKEVSSNEVSESEEDEEESEEENREPVLILEKEDGEVVYLTQIVSSNEVAGTVVEDVSFQSSCIFIVSMLVGVVLSMILWRKAR